MSIDMKLIKKNIVPKVAIVGHAGCGHNHSSNNFIQDDTGGLITTLNILQLATNADLTISDVEVQHGTKGYITIFTKDGGKATTYPRRGISYNEAKIIRSAKGSDAKFGHAITLELFGRYYGQGISECAVSLQTAIAMAAIDTFVKKFPDDFLYADEGIEGNIGGYIGAIVDIKGIPTAVMSIVNATEGGIGPNEDLEGNVAISSKKDMMIKLNMMDIPTITVEGKVYSPSFCDTLENEKFIVRGCEINDNPYIAKAVVNSAKNLNYDIFYDSGALKRVKNALRTNTQNLGKEISRLGDELSNAEYSYDKVRIIAQLAKAISQDCGGISFMSNNLHEIVGGIGLMPATSCVISLLITKELHDEILFPFIKEDDCKKFTDIVLDAIPLIINDYENVLEHIRNHKINNSLDLLTNSI